jgi:methanogenic corrinoid protein MtbC1
LKDEVILKQLADAIVKGDSETAEAKAKVISQYAKSPSEALDDLYDAFRTAESLHMVGEYNDDRFTASANAARASLNVLKVNLKPKQTRFTARICIGPVSGGNDVMSAIMGAMLTAVGCETIDISRATTAKELLRNAEQNRAEFLVVSFNEKTVDLAKEFVSEFQSGGFQNKFNAIAFARGAQPVTNESGAFAFVAREPLELLSKTTEFLIRHKGKRGSYLDRVRRLGRRL